MESYSLVNVAFIGEVKPCEFHWEPNQHNDQGYNGNDVRVHDPYFVNLGCEDTHQVKQIVEEVVVEQHLKVQGGGHWSFKHSYLVVWDVVSVVIYLVLPDVFILILLVLISNHS